MLSENIRKKIAESAVDFALNAFWVAISGAAVMLLAIAYGVLGRMDSRLLFAAVGGLVAFLLVAVTTVAIVKFKGTRRAPKRVGQRGVKRDATRALKEFAENVEAMTLRMNKLRRISEKAITTLEKIRSRYGDSAEKNHAAAARAANQIYKQASLMAVHSSALGKNVDQITGDLDSWLNWAIGGQHITQASELSFLGVFMQSLDSAIPGLEAFRQSSDGIRWVSAELDAAGAELAAALDTIIGKLHEARSFCERNLKRLEGLTSE